MEVGQAADLAISTMLRKGRQGTRLLCTAYMVKDMIQV